MRVSFKGSIWYSNTNVNTGFHFLAHRFKQVTKRKAQVCKSSFRACFLYVMLLFTTLEIIERKTLWLLQTMSINRKISSKVKFAVKIFSIINLFYVVEMPDVHCRNKENWHDIFLLLSIFYNSLSSFCIFSMV